MEIIFPEISESLVKFVWNINFLWELFERNCKQRPKTSVSTARGPPFRNYNQEKGDKDAICTKEEGTLGGALLFFNVVHQNREEGHQLFGIDSALCADNVGEPASALWIRSTSLTSRPRTSSRS